MREVIGLIVIAMRCLHWQLPIRREFDMRGYDSKATLRRMACVLALLAGGVGTALAQPATLRLGYGTAAEEPLWLVVAKPELAKNQGKAYTLDATRFTGSDKRGQAFEAGAIDLASSSANGVIFAAAEGVSAKIVASVSRESPRGFSTGFYVKDSSPIRSIADLKGKIVGINGFYTSGHLWLKTALDKHGLTDADAFPGDAGSARCRQGRPRAIPAAVRGARGEADEGPQDLRCEIRNPVRGGVDRPDRQGRVPQEECGCGPRPARRPQIGDRVLPGKPARGPPAPDRPQDGAGQSRRLREHERLLSR